MNISQIHRALMPPFDKISPKDAFNNALLTHPPSHIDGLQS